MLTQYENQAAGSLAVPEGTGTLPSPSPSLYGIAINLS